jgi:hypothetical protein
MTDLEILMDLRDRIRHLEMKYYAHVFVNKLHYFHPEKYKCRFCGQAPDLLTQTQITIFDSEPCPARNKEGKP